MTIKANCREQLTAEDFRFLATVLSPASGDSSSLTRLLVDPAARDAALESDRVLQVVLESTEPLPVSAPFYFCVLTRHLLKEFDREITDYIAGMLAAFLDIRRLRTVPNRPELQADYVVDMLTALGSASADDEFHIRVHVGNYSLFVSGIFPGHLRHRATVHGAPDISYYEKVGSTNYRVASDHRLARRHALTDVYRTIADRFSEVRCDLNRLSDRLLCIEPSWSVHS